MNLMPYRKSRPTVQLCLENYLSSSNGDLKLKIDLIRYSVCLLTARKRMYASEEPIGEIL